MLGIYEAHLHSDPNFPIICNHLYADRSREAGVLHWHESTELIICLVGEGTVISDTEKIQLKEGDIGIVNSSNLHTVYSDSYMEYCYLIADISLFEESDLPIMGRLLQNKIQDEEANTYLYKIIKEIQEKPTYYKAGVRAGIIWLFVYLYRNYTVTESYQPSRYHEEGKLAVVKSTVDYIRRNFSNEMQIDEISHHVGISKYYLCHTFKEVTGQTIIGHINFLRCKHARRLITTGACNVSESAQMSGFKNLSYFTRTYKKIMGELPSQTRIEENQK